MKTRIKVWKYIEDGEVKEIRYYPQYKQGWCYDWVNIWWDCSVINNIEITGRFRGNSICRTDDIDTAKRVIDAFLKHHNIKQETEVSYIKYP